MSKTKTIFSLLFCIAMVVGVYWIWFFRWNIYTWGDWGFYFPETAKDFIAFPQIWNSFGYGGIDIGLPLYPFARLLAGLLSQYLPPFQALHVLYLLPNVIMCAVSSFLLARYIHKSNLSGIIAAVIFSFNTYFLVIRGGHLPLMNAFALSPLALLIFLHGLKTSKSYFFILAGFIGSIAAAYEVRGAYLLFGLLFSLLIFYLPATPIKTIIKSSLTFIVAGVINLYWILGLFLSGSGGGESAIFSRQLFGAGYVNMVRSIALQLYQWSPNSLIGPGVQATPKYLWVTPILAFLGLYLGRKNRTIVYFGIVALMGIFFSKLTSQPFPGLYQWMYDYFPGFNLFREPSKFYFFIALGYAVLLSGFGVWMTKIRLNKSIRNIFYILTVGIICFPFIVNTRGVITGTLGDLLKPRSVPRDYSLANNLIMNQPGFFRTLYVPSQSRWDSQTSLKPALSMVGLVQGDWSKINSYRETGINYSYVGEITNLFNKAYFDKLIDMNSVKYLIIPTQDIENNNNMYQIYGEQNKYYELLKNYSFLKKIDSGASELQIYENSNFRPHFYTTLQMDTIYSSTISATPVEFTRLDAATYHVKLPKSQTPLYLNFTDIFHPGWVITNSNVTWQNAILKKLNLNSKDNHFSNDALMNVFRIDSNPDNAREFTVYFLPQAYVELGLRISILGFGMITGYLLFSPLIKKSHA